MSNKTTESAVLAAKAAVKADEAARRVGELRGHLGAVERDLGRAERGELGAEEARALLAYARRVSGEMSYVAGLIDSAVMAAERGAQ